jgi:DtxR family Mn-dependent transcriptional regulator
LDRQNKLTARAEEYLEAILNMRMEGKAVLAARLAERLMVSPPTVAGALGRLKRDGLISVNARKQIGLTARGKKEAISIVRKHRLVERLLTDLLGVDWCECHEEACRIEHAISPMVEDKLSERLGHPTICPHGNPIPEETIVRLPRGIRLDSIAEGTRVEVVRIGEEATRNIEFMRFLQKYQILPGRIFTVQEVATYAGTITLASEVGVVSIGVKAAETIWVALLTDQT